MGKIIQYGIFDLDGVIWNTMGICQRIASDLLSRRFDIPEYGKNGSREIYLSTGGVILEKQFKMILEKHRKNFSEKDIQEMSKIFFEKMKDVKPVVFKEVENVLKELKNKSIKLFITTGQQTDDTKDKLEKAGLLKYFDLVLGSDKIPKGPKHLDKFVKYLGISKEEFAKQSFYIGDGRRDMEISKEYETFGIGITNTENAEILREAGAKKTIGKIQELLEIVS